MDIWAVRIQLIMGRRVGGRPVGDPQIKGDEADAPTGFSPCFDLIHMTASGQ
ncbi:hypothetical protein [Actinomadura latina]|uniref:Uncharacterized protein n=1 Tax=Actinomadura latina TaxID=163603 RepID=A0A846YWG9_9ACTN|nr:hypothetical protein [Actinomadura latina]NKZ02576.1 hypothetical protein [Actinomadura latina]